MIGGRLFKSWFMYSLIFWAKGYGDYSLSLVVSYYMCSNLGIGKQVNETYS